VSAEILLPKIDEAMTQGKIVEWKKKEGDWVEKGEVIFTVETEKVTWEVEAPESGILSHISYEPGEEVPVGTIVAYVLKPGEKAPAPSASLKVEKKKPANAAFGKEAGREPGEFTPRTRIKASPLAKKLAREKKIDIALVQGSGPSGGIRKRDILKQEAEPSRATTSPIPLEEVKPLSSMRETIARRMTDSFQLIPHFHLSMEVDAEALSQTKEKVGARVEKLTGIQLTLTDLLLKTCAQALEEHPEINVQWTGHGIRQLADINIGFAVGVSEGLIVPVIRRANQKSLIELSRVRADFVERAQRGKVRMDEMRGGSMTLTNLGMYEIDQLHPIINPPESCILGVGCVREKPVAYQGQVIIRKRMNLTLSIDHRILDGVLGSRFLQRIKELMEQPIWLM